MISFAASSPMKRSAENTQTQARKIHQCLERENIDILKTFYDEGESAYTQSASDRTGLQEALDYMRQNKRRVTHFAVENLSRLARRIEDQTALLAGFRKAGVTLISVDEPNAMDSTAAGQFATGMIGLVNQFHSASLSDRVRDRMRLGTQSGRFLHVAPLGYLNAKMANGAKNLALDPERASLVRDAFAMIAEGNRLEQVLKIVTGLGLRSRKEKILNKQTMSLMLRNRVYCGWIRSGGITARGAFEPLISEELFQKCQDVLSGRVRKKEHRQNNDAFPLRGFVQCPSCKSKLTAGYSTGRKGVRVGYYFCWSAECRKAKKGVSVRKEILERDWILLLDMIQPHADYWQNLSENATAKAEKNQEVQRQIKKELSEHREKHARAVQARINGEISQEDFEIWKSSAARDVERLETILNDLQGAQDVVQTASQAKALSDASFSKLWTEAASLEERQAFQTGLFPRGIFWSKENSFFEPENRPLMSLLSEMIDAMDGSTAVPELSGRGEWI